MKCRTLPDDVDGEGGLCAISALCVVECAVVTVFVPQSGKIGASAAKDLSFYAEILFWAVASGCQVLGDTVRRC